MDRYENYSAKIAGKIGRNIYICKLPLALAVFGPLQIYFEVMSNKERRAGGCLNVQMQERQDARSN